MPYLSARAAWSKGGFETRSSPVAEILSDGC